MDRKPKWLWSWEHKYQFDNHSYTYQGTVSDHDVADFLKIEKTEQNLNKIVKNWIKFESALKDNQRFNAFLIDRYYEEASACFYKRED